MLTASFVRLPEFLFMPIQDIPIATIKVLQPKLPAAAKLMPYLERIDAGRIYGNAE